MRRALQLVPIFLLAGVQVFAAACFFSPRPRSVVLIVIDTLRQDHLGVYGYPRPTSPNIDQMAVDAAVFDRAVSASTWTLPAFGSMFTGHLLARHGAGVMVRDPELLETASAGSADSRDQLLRRLRDTVQQGERRFTVLDSKLPTLAGVLREAGYATGAVVNNAFLDPRFGLARGFDAYQYHPRQPERSAERTVEMALEWVKEKAGHPIFLLVHFMDVHMPYRPPESVSGRFTGGYEEKLGAELPQVRTVRERIAQGDEVARGLYIATYDEEIAYVDDQLATLFAGLQQHGYWDDTLMILTSDHGEALFEHGRWEHGGSVFSEVIRIPFLVRGPGVWPGRNPAPISLTDLMPTVLDALGVELENEMYGTSMWASITGAPPPERDLLIEGTLYGAEQKAIVRWPYKMIYQTDPTATLLFDLERDPDELVDLSTLEPELAQQLRDSLGSILLSAARERSTTQGVELDPAIMENLRALGYLR